MKVYGAATLEVERLNPIILIVREGDIEVGDLSERKMKAGKVTFSSKSVVDRGIAESMADFAAGRSRDL